MRRSTGWVVAVVVALATLSLAVFSEPAGAAPSAQGGPDYVSGIGIEVQPPAGVSGSPGGLGNVWEGSTLTALPGTWTGSGAVGFSYEWFRGDTVLSTPLAVGSTYTVTGPDVGSSLWVRVTATDANGSSTRDSTLLGPVIYRPPLLVRGPRIVGDPVVGNTVVADPGDWALVGAAVGQPITFTYRWYHCWEFASPQPDELPSDCNPFFDLLPEVDRRTIGEELYDPTKTYLKSQSVGVGLEVSIPDGAGATSSSVAWVYTDAILPRIVQNITAGQTLEGTVAWTATASAPLQQVVFALDGNEITSTDTTAPYEYLLDTTKSATEDEEDDRQHLLLFEQVDHLEPTGVAYRRRPRPRNCGRPSSSNRLARGLGRPSTSVGTSAARLRIGPRRGRSSRARRAGVVRPRHRWGHAPCSPVGESSALDTVADRHTSRTDAGRWTMTSSHTGPR